MSHKYIPPLAILLITICGCEKTESNGACGPEISRNDIVLSAGFFSKPSEIYWGVTGTTRSYTYNFTFANNCTKKNPKVSFHVALKNPNNTLGSPFSFRAATTTCFGVQPQSAVLTANPADIIYTSNESEIGMQQCFGGQTSATIYPFVTVSFATLGNSGADSSYLIANLDYIQAFRTFSEPK